MTTGNNTVDNNLETPDGFRSKLNPNGFIARYLEYHKMRTDSPEVFGIHLAIQLIGHSFGPYIINKIRPRAVHHNIYNCLLGQSGKSMKSTSMDEVAIGLYPPSYIGPNGFSPEGLLKKLQDYNFLMCPLGEFSTILRSLIHGGNMANFKEIANDLWGCKAPYIKSLVHKDKSYFVDHPYLSMSTTCTEEEYYPNLNPEMVHGGFMPRWLLIKSESPPFKPLGWLPDNVDKLELYLKSVVKKFYPLATETPTMAFKLSKEALIKYNEICEDLHDNPKWETVQPFVARYQKYIIKYADILFFDSLLELQPNYTNYTNKTHNTNNTSEDNVMSGVLVSLVQSDSKNTLITPVEQITQAWELIKPCLEYSLKVARYVDEDYVVRKLQLVLEKKSPLQWSMASRYTHLDKFKFKNAIETLIDRETAFVFKKEFVATGKKHARIICQNEYQNTERCKKCEYLEYCKPFWSVK